jgi:hypothetical protein
MDSNFQFLVATYHGWADPLIFPQGSIDYFNRVVAANGGLKRVQEFDRLFMVPGMNHCLGGPGAVNFGQSLVVPVSLDPEHDAILALQRWVEQGVAPDMLIATTDQPLATHAAENPTQPADSSRTSREVRKVPIPDLAAPSAGRASGVALRQSCQPEVQKFWREWQQSCRRQAGKYRKSIHCWSRLGLRTLK